MLNKINKNSVCSPPSQPTWFMKSFLWLMREDYTVQVHAFFLFLFFFSLLNCDAITYLLQQFGGIYIRWAPPKILKRCYAMLHSKRWVLQLSFQIFFLLFNFHNLRRRFLSIGCVTLTHSSHLQQLIELIQTHEDLTLEMV